MKIDAIGMSFKGIYSKPATITMPEKLKKSEQVSIRDFVQDRIVEASEIKKRADLLNGLFGKTEDKHIYTNFNEVFVTVNKAKDGTMQIRESNYATYDSKSYQFDKNNRLTSAIVETNGLSKYEYTYDRNGKINSVRNLYATPLLSLKSAEASELIDNITFEYDINGNLLHTKTSMVSDN